MKTIVPKFEGTIENSKLVISDEERSRMSKWVATFKDWAKVEIVIRKATNKRTDDQNRYYWGVVVPILSNYFGHDNPEDMHEDLKLLFNPVESKIEPGKKIGGTTTKMSTIEFMASDDSYVERVCRWASCEYNIYIPPPKKVDKE